MGFYLVLAAALISEPFASERRRIFIVYTDERDHAQWLFGGASLCFHRSICPDQKGAMQRNVPTKLP